MQIFGSRYFGRNLSNPPALLIDPRIYADKIVPGQIYRVAVGVDRPCAVEADFLLGIVGMVVGLSPVVGIQYVV